MFFLLAILYASGKTDAPMNKEKYSGHDNYWKMVPEIVICKNKTNFSKDQVKQALDLWKKP